MHKKIENPEAIVTTVLCPRIGFCLLDEEFAIAHLSSNCKEFILDCAYYTISNILCSSYKKISLDEVRLRTYNSYAISGKARDLLRKIEIELKFEKLTEIFTIDDTPNVVIFVGDKQWFLAPPMLSLYGLIIRNAGYHSLDKSFLETLDLLKGKDYFNTEVVEIVKKIIQVGPRKIFGDNLIENWNIPFIHGNGGISSLGHKTIKKFKPKWYEMLESSSLGGN